ILHDRAAPPTGGGDRQRRGRPVRYRLSHQQPRGRRSANTVCTGVTRFGAVCSTTSPVGRPGGRAGARAAAGAAETAMFPAPAGATTGSAGGASAASVGRGRVRHTRTPEGSATHPEAGAAAAGGGAGAGGAGCNGVMATTGRRAIASSRDITA